MWRSENKQCTTLLKTSYNIQEKKTLLQEILKAHSLTKKSAFYREYSHISKIKHRFTFLLKMRNNPCFVTRPMHTPSSCGKPLQPIPSLCLLFLAASFRKLRPLTRDHWSAGSMHRGSMAARSPHTRSLCELA